MQHSSRADKPPLPSPADKLSVSQSGASCASNPFLKAAFLGLITDSHLGSACAAPNAYFIAANASMTGRLLTLIMPPPG